MTGLRFESLLRHHFCQLRTGDFGNKAYESPRVAGLFLTCIWNVVGRMEKLGVLEEMTGQARNRCFHYEPYVRLFTEKRAESDK